MLKSRAMTDEDRKTGFFTRLRARLNRGDSLLTRDIRSLVPGGAVDEATYEELEIRLLQADVGVTATMRLLDTVRARLNRLQRRDAAALHAGLSAAMVELLEPCAVSLTPDSATKPFVLLMTGVNGAGKTTTIGKLAARFQAEGHSVMLAAADTFRAAAVEQLQTWGARHEVPVIAHAAGTDPAAVAHDAWQAARNQAVDVLIVDTAGRLHTNTGLMAELAKIKRVLQRLDAAGPHETLLVLDGSAGQNALVQARQFHAALGVTGIAMTKLDGTAKGGILLAVAEQLQLPIRYIGIGEAAEDLQPFNAQEFVAALLGEN